MSLKTLELIDTLIDAGKTSGLSQSTLTAYRRAWKDIVAFCQALDWSLETLTPSQAREIYDQWLAGKGRSSALQLHGAMRFLYNFFEKRNPFVDCPLPAKKPSAPLKSAKLTLSDIDRVLNWLETQHRTYFDVLARTVAPTIRETGLRFTTLASAPLRFLEYVKEDGSFPAGEEAIPLSEHLRSKLLWWGRFRDSLPPPRVINGMSAPLLFPGRDRQKIPPSTFNRHLARASKSVGLSVPVTAHALRAACVVEFLAGGTTPAQAVKRFGFADESVLRPYLDAVKGKTLTPDLNQ
jgi:Site-specific recombinase XerD